MAYAMRWVNETRWPASLSCLRRPSIAVTASVRNEVAVGIDRLSSMYFASMPAPPRSGWGVDAGAGAMTGSAGAGAPPFATVARTSAFVMRPPGPEPVTFARSIPSAAAMRAATGEILASDGIGRGAAVAARSPSPSAAGSAGASGVVAAAPFVAVVIRAMTWPTVTVSPSPASTSVIVPAAGAGSSTSILSVEISAMAWPSSTVSPAATCHSTSVPSETDSPAVGVTMSSVSPGAASVAGSAGAPLPEAPSVSSRAGALAPLPPPLPAGAAGLAPLPVAISASTAPTWTVSPSAAWIFATVPLAGAGTSASTLSVETSTMTSSASTRSPSCLCHSRTVPSVTDSPIWGSVTCTVVSTAMTALSDSSVRSSARSFLARFDRGQSPACPRRYARAHVRHRRPPEAPPPRSAPPRRAALRRGPPHRGDGPALRGRPDPAARGGVVRAGHAAEPRARAGDRRARAARHAPVRLRVRGRERDELRGRVPRARGGRQRAAELRLRPGLARDVPDLEVRLRRAEGALAAGHGRGRADRLLRADRARLGERPVVDEDERQARRLGLGAQRREDVDHERRRRRRGGRLGAHRRRHPRLRRSARHLRLHDAGHPPQALAARVGHVGARLRRRAAARRRRPARRDGDARPAVVPERGALRDPLGRGRRGAHVPRRGARIREVPPAVWPPDRGVPAHAAEAREHDARAAEGPAARAVHRPAEGRGPRRARAHQHGQAQQRARGARDRPRGAHDPRGERDQLRVPGHAPRREPRVRPDLRGHERDPHAHPRPGDDGRERVRVGRRAVSRAGAPCRAPRAATPRRGLSRPRPAR